MIFFNLKLILKSASRTKMKLALTLLTISFSFVIFGTADVVGYAFEGGRDLSVTNRLVTSHKVSMVNTLPIKYRDQILTVKGVKEVSYASWFGGYFQNERNQFPQFAVSTKQYMTIFDELVLSESEFKQWQETANGAVVGKDLAERFGWSVGDVIPLKSTIWRTKQDSDSWEFVIKGIYNGRKSDTETGLFLFHHDFFDENRSYGNYTVGWFSTKLNSDVDEHVASAAINALFANSEAETKTATEQAFLESFSKQYGDLSVVFEGVMAIVIATLLMICFTTMAQIARERRKEMAVLLALGFSKQSIFMRLIFESVFILVIGAILGLLCSIFVVEFIKGEFESFASSFNWHVSNFLYGLAISVTIGVAAAIFPAIDTVRRPIATTLRKG